MKKLVIITVVVLAGTIGARSQGIVDFANLASGVSAAISDSSGYPSLNYIENGGFEWGFSNPFILTPNTVPSPASSMLGLTSFGMNIDLELPPSPEPSTFAIGGLGAVALLFLRRLQRAKMCQV